VFADNLEQLEEKVSKLIDDWFYERHGCYCDSELLAENIVTIIMEEIEYGSK